jgi:hypothetical protein
MSPILAAFFAKAAVFFGGRGIIDSQQPTTSSRHLSISASLVDSDTCLHKRALPIAIWSKSDWDIGFVNLLYLGDVNGLVFKLL